MKHLNLSLLAGLLIGGYALFFSCEMPATSFNDVEPAIYLEKAQKSATQAPDSSIKVMTWNIRFGIGRGPWFGDACGYKVIYKANEIIAGLTALVARINEVQPDVLILQEVDINSKRSAYVNQLQWLMDHTYFNYAVYGSQWKAQFIPSDGLGRMDEGNAIFSRWPLSGAVRIQLALRQDQSSLERYFYERCCMVEAKVNIPGFAECYVVNIHASAFATDNTKLLHLQAFKNELDKIASRGVLFFAGGDLNTIPPGSDSTDFCLQDKCPGESFHQPGDNPMHKEGSNYAPEKEWLVPLFNDYKCIFPLSDYLKNQKAYFTHATQPDSTWNRTIDYIFTNNRWRYSSTVIHQNYKTESDHIPISGELILRK